MRSSNVKMYCSWFADDELESAPMEKKTNRKNRVDSNLRENLSFKSRNRGTVRGNKGTLGYKFKDQLKELHTSLMATTPHFIRCIKPNMFKVGVKDDQAADLDKFHGKLVLRQMRYSQL